MASFKLTKDTVTPDLRAKLARIANPRPVMEAIGLVLVSLTKRAFSESALRPSSWANKKNGLIATLRKSGALWQSIRIGKLDSRSVTVVSDRKYAAAHQLGSTTRGLPARPFFPFTKSNQPTQEAQRRIESAAKRKLSSLLK